VKISKSQLRHLILEDIHMLTETATSVPGAVEIPLSKVPGMDWDDMEILPAGVVGRYLLDFDQRIRNIENHITSDQMQMARPANLPEATHIVRETIRELPDGRYRLVSKAGKNLGTYDTREDAEKREKQVNYFKSKDD
jgi:hypothetical protein